MRGGRGPHGMHRPRWSEPSVGWRAGAARKIACATFLLSIVLTGAVQTGPEVGTRMPAFEAPDQNGKVHSLQSLLGPKGAVLVFYRSADW